jgi:hypothetical protein
MFGTCSDRRGLWASLEAAVGSGLLERSRSGLCAMEVEVLGSAPSPLSRAGCWTKPGPDAHLARGLECPGTLPGLGGVALVRGERCCCRASAPLQLQAGAQALTHKCHLLAKVPWT